MQQETKNTISLGENQEEKLFGKPEKYDYSKYSEIDGFGLDEELVEKFAQIAQKLDLSQYSAQMLLELAVEMSQKQTPTSLVSSTYIEAIKLFCSSFSMLVSISVPGVITLTTSLGVRYA